MSVKKIELSIFNPLGEYFKVMSAACGGITNGCKDDKFKSLITNDCDISGNVSNKSEVSDRFKKALKLFALNLKTFDSPISSYTIKGQLYTIFQEAFKKDAVYEKSGNESKLTDSSKSDILNKIVDKINKSNLLKMNEPWNGTSTETYDENLENQLNLTSAIETELMDKIFNTWLLNVYSIYDNNFTRFQDFMKDIKVQWDAPDSPKEFEPTHIEAFNLFFEILTNEVSQPLEGAKGFWNKLTEALNDTKDVKFDALITNTRINIKVVDSLDALKGYSKPKLNAKALKAGIVFAFPRQIQGLFNDSLKSRDNSGTGDISKADNIYKIKKECMTGSYKLDKKQVEQVFKFIKNEGRSSSRGESYVGEFPDETLYNDGTSEYSIDDLNEYVKEYKDAWAKDYKGDLYTRWDCSKDDEKPGNKWIKYTEKQLAKDIESFSKKEGNCGHLCIFDDPEKCENFFKDMTAGKEITYDTLAEMVNGNSFKDNYEELKKNIVKVNPAFVIGTLKAFKFEKWEQLNRDGSKTIKVESFSRWWTRKGKDFMGTPTRPSLTGVKTHSNRDDKGNELLDPVPPENLELFLKLLVTFINYNQFVLNPQKKDNIIFNRLQRTSHDAREDEEQEFLYIIENGKQIKVPNGAYKGNKNEANVESLGSALEQIKKNIRFTPPDSTPENRIVSNGLLGLLYGMNRHSNKFLFSRSLPFSTGFGNPGAFRGGAVDITNDNEVKEFRKELKPCARAAFDGLVIASRNLAKKNKTIKSDEFDTFIKDITNLSMLENKLTTSLILTGKYQKIINSIDDESSQEIGLKEMESEVDNYKDIAGDVSTKADGLTMLISKMFNVPTSRYVPMN